MADPKLDSFGLGISTESAECVRAINAYYEAVLAYRPFSAWAVAEEAVAADPKCPMARVLAADHAFCRGDAARAHELLESLSTERADGGTAWTPRESAYAGAWEKWVTAGDPVGCYDLLLGVVEQHPCDLFAVKRGHIMGLILGDGAKILAIVQKAADAAAGAEPPPRFLHGMWAFGLEQQGQYEEAEATARKGLEYEGVLGPDAWLDHGLAHALYFQGEERLEDAVEFLTTSSVAWSAEALHPFLYTHCWWHLALLHCESRQIDEAIKIFDTRLWAEADQHMRSDPQVQLNALGLLWRLETRGARDLAHPRWAGVLAACHGVSLPAERGSEKAPLQHSDLLLDILLVRALCVRAAANAQPLDEFLTATSAHAEQLAASAGAGSTERAEVYRTVAGCVADLFRDDQPEAGLPLRHSKARQTLRDLRQQWGSLGGSEEQRCVLLEAVEGPIVCGAPEKNFDKLFY